MKNCFRSSAAKEGFILISVMISVTLLLTAATAFAWYARTEMKRVEANRFILQARSVAEIACSLIAEKIAADKNGYDSRTEPLYQYGGIFELNIGNYDIRANIEPLDDRIPIRGLFLADGITLRSEYEPGWNRIWEYLDHPELGMIVLDFMDKDDKQKLGGSERDININRVVSDLTELKLINEINDGILWGTEKNPGGLGIYLTAYGNEKLNVNVAKPESIAVLDERIDIAQAQSLVAARNISPIRSLSDLKKIPGFPDAAVTKLANVLGFESAYFRLNMKVTETEQSERNFRVILQRNGSLCKIVRWEE